VCGATLGRYSFVAAGAVVTHDVPDYGLVMGVPAALSGWVCACGVRLCGVGEVTCAACGRDYCVGDDTCRELASTSVVAA
jgi:UDP-2-acetamido-3-amino-2,3-dideoxy-glucuronate N-acetyltransferase